MGPPRCRSTPSRTIDGGGARCIFSFRPSKGDTLSRAPKTDTRELLQGTLDMLVLKALQLGPMHGWGITARIEGGSRHVLELNQGSLYPALYRPEKQGFISSAWDLSENNRRARFYSLTPAGRRQLAAERAQWERLSGAVNLVLRMEG